MKLAYGYSGGKFVLAIITDETPAPKILQRISIGRRDAQKISKHMMFGREGETRLVENHQQLLVLDANLADEVEITGALNLREATQPPFSEMTLAHEAGIRSGMRADNGDPDTIVPAPSPHKRRPV